MNCGFSKSLISAVVCQRDNAYLEIDSETDSNEYVIFDGYLICPKCRASYEIKNGILDLIYTKFSRKLCNLVGIFKRTHARISKCNFHKQSAFC